MWRLDGSELLSSSSDEESVVLGVLEESVVCVCDSGLVRISHPVDGTQPVEAQLENSHTGLTLVNSVLLPKRGKVFLVSKEGFLYQVSSSSSCFLWSVGVTVNLGCRNKLFLSRNNTLCVWFC